MRLARLGVADVERWHARMRRAGVGETAIRGRHSALRAALSQAVRTVAAVEALRQERAVISPYLFAFDENPPPPARIGWWWTRARSAAGIDRTWRLHDLRHWSATVAISGGHDVRTVAGRLGHANPAMTLRVYAHDVEAADEAVAIALGQALAAAPASG